jgi:hypothetical protein
MNNRRQILNDISLYILIICLLYSIASVLFIENQSIKAFIPAILAILLNLIVYAIMYKWFKLFLALTLFVGSLNLLQFLPVETTIRFNLSMLKSISLETIDLQVFSSLLFLLHLILNRKFIFNLNKMDR